MWVKKQCTNWDLSLRKSFSSQLKEKSVSAGWKEKEVMFIFLAFKREAKEFDRERTRETQRERLYNIWKRNSAPTLKTRLIEQNITMVDIFPLIAKDTYAGKIRTRRTHMSWNRVSSITLLLHLLEGHNSSVSSLWYAFAYSPSYESQICFNHIPHFRLIILNANNQVVCNYIVLYFMNLHFSHNPKRQVSVYMIAILQMRKLWVGEMKWLSYVYKSSEGEKNGAVLRFPNFKFHSLSVTISTF